MITREAASGREERVRAIGRELFGRVRGEVTHVFAGDRLTAGLLAWAMTDEDAKLQLFRFVDVLPALGDAAETVRHLRDYLGDRPGPFARLTRAGLVVPDLGWLGRQRGPGLPRPVRRGTSDLRAHAAPRIRVGSTGAARRLTSDARSAAGRGGETADGTSERLFGSPITQPESVRQGLQCSDAVAIKTEGTITNTVGQHVAFLKGPSH
jgi:hypothetical protein